MQTFMGREYAPESAVATAVELQIDGDALLVKATVFDADSVMEKTGGRFYLRDFEIEVGGFSSTVTILKHKPTKITLMIEDPGFVNALAQTKTPLADQASKASRKIKNVPRKLAMTWGTILGGTFAAVFIAYFSMEGIVGWIADRIPPQVERIIGETYVHLMPGSHSRVESENQHRIDRIAERLLRNLKNNPYQFEFIVVDDTQINAASLPGGIVLVYSGLIDHAQNDHEIAGVLGHEIGHVTRKHALRAMLHGIGFSNLVSIAFSGVSPEVVSLMGHTVDLEKLSYGRSQEYEADNIGTQLAVDSDYNPRGMVEFFSRLENELGGSNTLLAFLSTHPMPADRVTRIKQQIEQMEAARKARHLTTARQ